MKLRSVLFVPGDSERKFAKARTTGADALILDLEDSVAPSQKPPRANGDPSQSGCDHQPLLHAAALEIAHARRTVAAFAADASAGAIGLNGKMIDIPHLEAARKVLASI